MLHLLAALPSSLGAALMALPPPTNRPPRTPRTRGSPSCSGWLDEEFRRHPFVRHPAGQPRATTTGSTTSRPQARAGRPERAEGPGSPSCRRRSTTPSSPATGRSTSRSGRTRLDYAALVRRRTTTASSTTRASTASTSPTACSSCSRNRRCRGSGTSQNAAKRIAHIPKVVAAAKESLKNPPKVLTEIAIKRNLGAIAFYEKEHLTSSPARRPASEPLATPCRAAVDGAQGLPEVARKGTAAAVDRRLAARQGEVRQEARPGTRRRADRRRGA